MQNILLAGTMLAAMVGLSFGALFAPSENPEDEVRHGQLPVPSDCHQISPGSGCGLQQEVAALLSAACIL